MLSHEYQNQYQHQNQHLPAVPSGVLYPTAPSPSAVQATVHAASSVRPAAAISAGPIADARGQRQQMPRLQSGQLAVQTTGAATVASLADKGAGDRSLSSKPHGNQKEKEPEINMCSVKQFLPAAASGYVTSFSTAHSTVVIAEH